MNCRTIELLFVNKYLLLLNFFKQKGMIFPAHIGRITYILHTFAAFGTSIGKKVTLFLLITPHPTQTILASSSAKPSRL